MSATVTRHSCRKVTYYLLFHHINPFFQSEKIKIPKNLLTSPPHGVIIMLFIEEDGTMRTHPFVLLLLLIIPSIFVNAQELPPVENPAEPGVDITRNAPLNINDWIYWQSLVDLSGHNPYSDSDGGFFPDEKSNVIWADGFVWAGYVQDPDIHKPSLRAGGFTYWNGTQPGWIAEAGDDHNPPVAISPDDPRARLYRIRPDYQNISDAELQKDAALLFNLDAAGITGEITDSLRMMYKRDWLEWPGDLGAPYYDLNNNGQWDAGIDRPGLAHADQIIWYVVNDLDREKCYKLFGSPPIGMELQVTAWAYRKYRHWFGLDGVIFKRYRLINKSGFAIDSMFIGHFADIDIGNYSDDLAGCDSVLSLGYIYNGVRNPDFYYQPIHPRPPSVGYALMQGPLVSSPGDTALFNFKQLANHKNLPMTSFAYLGPGGLMPDPTLGSYEGTLQLYNLLNGYMLYRYTLIPWYHLGGPHKGMATKFPLNGDPVTGEGDVDGREDNPPPGDRRIFVCSGPFNMQPGDTQEIVFAIIGSEAPGSGNYLLSISQLKQLTVIFNWIYRALPESITPAEPYDPEPDDTLPDVRLFILGQNYPNPFNDQTTLPFRLLTEMDIRLEVFNHLGQKVKSIYRGKAAADVHRLTWDGSNDRNLPLPSGIYYLRLTDGLQTQVKKMVYLR